MKYRYTYEIKITNKNSNLYNHYYYGKHTTDNLDDNYFGSGKLISNYIKKHGTNGLQKTILNFYSSNEELLVAEKELVEIKQKELGDFCMNLMRCGIGLNNWKDYLSEEQYKQRCRNMSIGQHTKLTDEQRKQRAAYMHEQKMLKTTPEQRSEWALYGGLANKKRLEDEKIHKEWVDFITNRHKTMDKETKKKIYNKVSNSLKTHHKSEEYRASVKQKQESGEYIKKSKEASDIWRNKFVKLFGCQLEGFRDIGKAHEAMELFKSNNTTVEQINEFIKSCFTSVVIDGVEYPSRYHAKQTLKLSTRMLNKKLKEGGYTL